MREVLVWPRIDNILWQNLPDETYCMRIRDRLVERLENHYERLKSNRHPDDERLLVLTLFLPEGENWHTFEFHVDDTTADTCLIVSDVHHFLGKTWIR